MKTQLTGLIVFFSLLTNAWCKKEDNDCKGVELEDDWKLLVGIQARPKREDCVKKSKAGDMLTVHYTAHYYKTCEVFDSTRDREPFQFILGKNMAIPGFDEGLIGMCEGEVRKLSVPSKLSYESSLGGQRAPGLVYRVELVKIAPL